MWRYCLKLPNMTSHRFPRRLLQLVRGGSRLWSGNKCPSPVNFCKVLLTVWSLTERVSRKNVLQTCSNWPSTWKKYFGRLFLVPCNLLFTLLLAVWFKIYCLREFRLLSFQNECRRFSRCLAGICSWHLPTFGPTSLFKQLWSSSDTITANIALTRISPPFTRLTFPLCYILKPTSSTSSCNSPITVT